MAVTGAARMHRRITTAEARMRVRQVRALRRAALLAEREIKLGIRSGAPGGKKFKPLALSTLLLRRGTKPLIDRGDLVGSITHKVDEKKLQAFVGVLRTAKASGGQSVINIALAHEFGTAPFTIPVTPNIRRLFRYLAWASGGTIKPIGAAKSQISHPGIPERPFIRPTIQRIRPKIQKIILKAMTETGGIL